MKRTKKGLWMLPALALFTFAAKAQNFDPKKVKLMDPPDLQVTAMGLLRADDDGDWLFTIQVAVKNNSFIKAPGSKLKIMVQNPDSPNPAWQVLAYDEFPAVPAQNAVLKEIEIHDKRGMMRKVKSFNLKVIADADNKINEKNERNNESAMIKVSKRS